MNASAASLDHLSASASSYAAVPALAAGSTAVAAAATVDNSLFPFLPRWFKLVVCLAFLVNIRSWPGQWHVRVWWHAVYKTIRARVVCGVIPHLRDNLRTNGSDPWRLKAVKRYWAGPDDCDWQGHLSNSCYAKHLDSARMKVIVDFFSPFLVAGGGVALAGANYSFPKEIKALASFDIEFTIGGFGDKWIYLVGTFVGPPDDRASSRPPDVNAGFRASLARSKEYLDVSLSPTTISGPATPLPRREDGRVVHCVSTSLYCFKLGRLTVPPAVVLAFCGYGARSNWERFELLYAQGPRALRSWLRDGWKQDRAHEEFEAVGKAMGRKGEEMRSLLAQFATT